MPKEITISNGRRIREWIIFGVAIITLVIGGAVGWTKLAAQVSGLEIESQQLATENKIAFEVIKKEGTFISQQNRRNIIGIKKDVEYTRKAVTRIETQLEKISNHIQ